MVENVKTQAIIHIMNNKNIKSVSFGCRLNALESEKIQKMLSNHINSAIVVNTCAVTAEAERQSGQAVRKIARENPGVQIFVTGCAATRNPELFRNIPKCTVIHNADKMKLESYIGKSVQTSPAPIIGVRDTDTKLSKKFIQIQNGCNHSCTYCITRALRGPAMSFEYENILQDIKDAVSDGFYEIVLTGVDIASYVRHDGDKVVLLSDLCKKLLSDVPEIQRLRLSSLDPAVPDIQNIIDLILQEPRMMPHIHFSMQSGSDTILKQMGRRHNANMVRNLVQRANNKISFSWDIICGFPGETDTLFNETLNLVHELSPIKIHAFPFSPRPDTVAANMPNQINHSISKERVKIINNAANQNKSEFMRSMLNTTVSALVEENNTARCPHDIAIKIGGEPIKSKTICDVQLLDVCGDIFVGQVILDK